MNDPCDRKLIVAVSRVIELARNVLNEIQPQNMSLMSIRFTTELSIKHVKSTVMHDQHYTPDSQPHI